MLFGKMSGIFTDMKHYIRHKQRKATIKMGKTTGHTFGNKDLFKDCEENTGHELASDLVHTKKSFDCKHASDVLFASPTGYFRPSCSAHHLLFCRVRQEFGTKLYMLLYSRFLQKFVWFFGLFLTFCG
jgi:hypothetical protein